jgi:hypothetical protein
VASFSIAALLLIILRIYLGLENSRKSKILADRGLIMPEVDHRAGPEVAVDDDQTDRNNPIFKYVL